MRVFGTVTAFTAGLYDAHSTAEPDKAKPPVPVSPACMGAFGACWVRPARLRSRRALTAHKPAVTLTASQENRPLVDHFNHSALLQNLPSAFALRFTQAGAEQVRVLSRSHFCGTQAWPSDLIRRREMPLFQLERHRFRSQDSATRSDLSRRCSTVKSKFSPSLAALGFPQAPCWRSLRAELELHASLLHARQPHQSTPQAPFRTLHSHDQPI